ncbi:hypothetical protein LGQ03_04875 [Loktanella sp. TSTF-M6]|uniref:Uncharacterized protein n=1 Tax=Loktanella gaetbuli TaxID=2881335 RepID=A0ABS8BS48_9RHOB|nr:hypothetical protein [Loktanella gaetbuli]MCB5198564.1 hypothetical protein [Loktanella gaetbuli]
MKMSTEVHGDLACSIDKAGGSGQVIGIISYKSYRQGQVTGPTIEAVQDQFRTICELVDGGGILRRDIIMLGYSDESTKGDVLLTDGEIIGEWKMDEADWCHFTVHGVDEPSVSAPSMWMLHDAIADWIERSSGNGSS